MKKYLLFASAILAFASCTSDTFTGTDDEARQAQGEKAITFGFDVPAATRATGQEAATKLGNQFIVYGEKSEDADGYKYDEAADDAHQLVFQNYVVKYVNGSDYTTTSNTKGWEYVGYTQTYGNNVRPKADETQTIKYWDYSASNYVFTAFSALESDLTNAKVKVTKVQEKTDGNMVYDKGYTVEVTADANLSKLYFSDRQVIAQGTGADRTATNAYGGNVTFTFRNGMSQVRAAMYENIPGYKVVIDKFYYVDAATPTFATMTTDGTDKFYANVPNIAGGTATTLNVTYYNSGTRVNQPKVTVDETVTTPANFIALGTNLKATTELGESISDAVYDKSDKSYTLVFPQEANAKNLKLKVDYTLTNAKTGETIKVYGATAEVPFEYLQWKANFSYTYIFKISDNTNGKTKLPDGVNPDSPEGLYPITFDAAVVVAEDGQAEYITTVSEPSITTFGVKDSKYVHGGNEYAVGTNIYATIVQGSGVITPVLTGTPNAYVYTATCSDPAYITEAAVAEAIAEKAIGRVTTPNITIADASASIAATVPGEDGKPITSLANKAILISSATAGYYVVAYKATAGSATATTADYSATATYYSMTADAQGFYPVATPTAAQITDWATEKANFTTAPTQPVYVYKVIKVVAAP